MKECIGRRVPTSHYRNNSDDHYFASTLTNKILEEMTSTAMLITFSEGPFHHQGQHYSPERSDSFSSSNESLPTMDPVTTYYPEDMSKDLQLEVSGSCFVLKSCVFHKLAALPWQKIHAAAYRLEGVSPEAFELCLDYILFATLPKRKRMNSNTKEELKTLANNLKLTGLADHMASKRGSPKAASMKKKQQKTGPPSTRKQGRFSFIFGCKRRTGAADDVEQSQRAPVPVQKKQEQQPEHAYASDPFAPF
uniref:Uncharacterized protein n=1 Tax=Seminavis robusta TaxID=568900 RepID=A0A9N8DY25_9STRA|nr:expressed unknown protein [Seminavis robusta]|eukprot:Sro368_g127970.1 n/a (250) ;mRNA; r:35424-36251